nr:hypothetical protein [Sedimentibacter sp.]
MAIDVAIYIFSSVNKFHIIHNWLWIMKYKIGWVKIMKWMDAKAKKFDIIHI